MEDPPATNHLANETSPYLLQHARNPVEWYPWGEEALRRAREEDRPIFLSVGYAACHWCHVMEHESFESEAIARILNAHFVCIKVDREERPDLDELYMNAVQILTGSGGWPMSVWLTPDLKPFYAGTYFPPTDRWGRPGFATVLNELAGAWRDRRGQVEQTAGQVADALRQAVAAPGAAGGGDPDRELVRRAVDSLRRRFDPAHGGFGQAPKFPPSMALELIHRQHRREPDPELLRMVILTLDGMARGGMYDQVGGGFHRYSTDARWLVPHFEKMLYDNALLVPVYLDAWRETGDAFYRRVAEETLAWVRREMTDPEGGFYSTLDADSEGEEGKFYVWTPGEVSQVLGADDGALFSRIYDITPSGNFEGRSISHLRRPIADWAAELKLGPDALQARLDGMRARLYEARAHRVWPAKDDKILTGWNGLMISAFARAAQVLDDAAYADAAARAASFVLDRLRPEGRLLHTYRAGQAKQPAFQDDYAFLARGLLDLHAATGDPRWRDEARALVDEMTDLFWDEAAGGFFLTARDQEVPIARSKSPYDGAIPSGNSVGVMALLRLRALGEDGGLDEKVRRTLAFFHGWLERAPDGFHQMLIALDEFAGQQAARGAAAPPGVVDATATLGDGALTPGRRARLTVRLHIQPGWHVNANRTSEEYLIPTVVEILPERDLSVVGMHYPEPALLPSQLAPDALLVYEGEPEITADLEVAPGAPPGDSRITVRVRCQPCEESRCLAPVEQELTVPVRFG